MPTYLSKFEVNRTVETDKANSVSTLYLVCEL